jgi:archaeal flagellar protein FlaI
MVYETEVIDGVLKMNCMGGIFGASIEDFDVIMARVIDRLTVDSGVNTIVLSETRDHEYDAKQTRMLKQVAAVINFITKEQRILSGSLKEEVSNEFSKWYPWLYNVVTFQMRGDPIGAYLNIVRQIRHLKILRKKETGHRGELIDRYISDVLVLIQERFEKIEMIDRIEDKLMGYHIGDRSLYRKLFHPMTRPNFMFTKYITKAPKGELVKRYDVGGSAVEIFKMPEKVRPLYHIVPPEFKLSEQEYTVLDDARRYLEERQPHELEAKDQDKMREIFRDIGLELIRDLADIRKINFSTDQVIRLSNILTRYTAGYGVIELLLNDPNTEDISLNSPLGSQPMFLNHSEFGECETNLVPTKADGDRLATRFKLLSGRPLDEANPVLDTEIRIPGGLARVAAIGPRLSPEGLAFSLRKHRFKPWTFPLFMNANFFDPLFAGLLWFVTSYGRTVLVAGTRGSGKSSLLGSMMLQILPSNRIISVEDTFELPIEYLRKLNYNVERMKSRSVITRVELELSAEDALRTALRLGDSCLFVGEVRSTEAKALYEAMRIGALANVVAGTIHGESAYGVFDRVVNDLGVPITSFKATDFVVVCNKLKTADGLKSFRRVVEMTEVRKHWKTDPDSEKGFVNLMQYSSDEDKLKPTDIFLNGESYILNEISKRVPGWAGRWDKVWENINLRARILKKITDAANETGKKDLMEAETCLAANQVFHLLTAKVREEVGEVDHEYVESEWDKWFKNHVKTF